MGFDDEDFYKAQSVGISNTQLYKQAGNSRVVNVLEKIFKEPKSIDALINILVSKKNLLQLLSNPKIIKYYDLANIKEIFKY